MHDSSFDEAEEDMEDLLSLERSTDLQIPLDNTQLETRDGQPDETREIQISPELKN